MRIITAAATLAITLAGLLPRSLAAQATGDQARIAFGISLGYVQARSLWSITGQPLNDPPLTPDTLSIKRRIRPTITFGFHGTYFSGDHLGYTGEAFLLGIGFRDQCFLTYASGSTRNAQVCSSLNGREKAATAVALSAGLIYRVMSRKSISPYARASAGVLVGSQSSVRTEGEFVEPQTGSEPITVIIFPDERSSHLSPIGVLAAGFTANMGPGYQLRWEFRDNIAGVRAVTGATAVSGLAPPTATRLKHLLGFTVGFEVVLERRRGRRY